MRAFVSVLVLVAIVGAYWLFTREETLDPRSRNYQAGFDDGANAVCHDVERAFPNLRETLRQRRIC